MSKERFKIKLAVYLILRQGDKVLLSLRSGTGYMDGMFSLVAGHVDGGEASEDALVRETYEEAGITIDPAALRLVFVAHRLKDGPEHEYIDLFFECTEWQGEIANREPEKCGGLEWYSMSQLPEDTLGYVGDVLRSYESGMNYKSTQGIE